MDRVRTRKDLARSLASVMVAEAAGRKNGGPTDRWGRYAGFDDTSLAAAYDVEVKSLLRSAYLRRAVKTVADGSPEGRIPERERDQLAAMIDQMLNDGQRHVAESLEALLGAAGRRVLDTPDSTAHEEPGPTSRSGMRALRFLRREVKDRLGHRVLIPLILLNGIVIVVLSVPLLLHLAVGTPLPEASALQLSLGIFAVWALAFLPGWLFVRFLDRRAGALWDEYTIHLHRLGLDLPGHLPEPPRTSQYHDAWELQGGPLRSHLRNIYQEKFDAYYGRSVSRFGTDVDRPVQTEALFPVFLCTAVLAVGWTAVLYDAQGTFGQTENPSTWTMLSFSFVGAYAFFLQMLLRRYFQTDLRAGAYVAGYVRLILAVVVVLVLASALASLDFGGAAIAVAFVIGSFPVAGIQYLHRLVSRALRGRVPSVEPAYPLNRLDGLNVWYEARLLEEGIEDLQNLMTAKIVDVLLHTRVPVARLVDWIDQALLLVHLPAEPLDGEMPRWWRRSQHAQDAATASEEHARRALRECGIRGATSLQRALDGNRSAEELESLLNYLDEHHVPRATVLTLRYVLDCDRRAAVLYNWQQGDAEVRLPLPRGPLAEPCTCKNSGPSSRRTSP